MTASGRRDRRSRATAPADEVRRAGEPYTDPQDEGRQIVWLNRDTSVEVTVNEHDQVRVELGPSPYGIVLVGDRYQLHTLVIEMDRQLSKWARQF